MIIYSVLSRREQNKLEEEPDRRTYIGTEIQTRGGEETKIRTGLYSEAATNKQIAQSPAPVYT